MQDFISKVEAGNLPEVESLLQKEPSLAEARDANGSTVIQKAAYMGNSAMVKLLLSASPTLDMATACSVGDLDAVAKAADERPESVNEMSADGFRPLCLAAAFGHEAVLALLLERNADPTLRSTTLGVAPMDSAIFGRSVRIVQRLLDAGVDPNVAQGGGFRPLHGAAQHGDIEIVKLLLAHGADSSAKSDAGKTAHDFATEYGHIETAELLM